MAPRFQLRIDETLAKHRSTDRHDPDAPKILCVDDEAHNLNLLETLLSNQYEVHTADSGQRAIEIIQEQEFSIVLSDQRMPRMLGTELLQRVREIAPATVRILLTAYTDVEDIIDSINRSGVFRYLIKPWNNNELMTTLKSAVETHRLHAVNTTLADDLHKTNQNLEERVRQQTRELAKAMQLKIDQTRELSSLGELVTAFSYALTSPITTLASSYTALSTGVTEMSRELAEFQGDDGNHDQDSQKIAASLKSVLTTLDDLLGSTSTTTQRLTDLSYAIQAQGHSTGEPSPHVLLNEMVRESLIITGSLTKLHKVNENLGDVPEITCHRNQIGQVFTNLIASAANAIEGRTSHATTGERLSEGCIQIATSHAPRDLDGVLICISHNGTPISSELREKLQGDFLTEKATESESELGLFITAGIVKDHHGTLAIEDDPELGGSRFEVWLPIDLDTAGVHTDRA